MFWLIAYRLSLTAVFLTAYSLPLIAVLLTAVFAEELTIVAVVNDEVITQAELEKVLAPVYLQLNATRQPEEVAAEIEKIRPRILEQLIEEKLMLQEAKKPRAVEVSKGKIGIPPPITVTDIEIDEMVDETASKFEGPEAFEQALKEQGLSMEDLRARYQEQITIEKLIGREVRSKVSVSPSEITAYYEAHPDEFEMPPAVQVATILIRPKDSLDLPRAGKLAEDLRRKALGGADFYDLARRYSDGPNAKMGGRIGYLEKGKGLAEIDSVLFTLKAGDISPIIKTTAGLHLFRVEAIRPARRATLEEAQANIRQRLTSQKGAARYKEWIEKLKADAYITIK